MSYAIECSRCATDWRLDHQTLVLRSSEVALANATQVEQLAAARLRTLAQEIVGQFFAAFSAPTKKAEHAELERLGLTNMSYRQYLEHRRGGGTVASAPVPRRNAEWLKQTAAFQGREGELETLSSAHREAKEARQRAYEQVVRRRVA